MRSGREGVQAIETHHPHIVLTDVSMPNMDGIALLKYVREKHIACEFILISSYSEFRYAQEALKLAHSTISSSPLNRTHSMPVSSDAWKRWKKHSLPPLPCLFRRKL